MAVKEDFKIFYNELMVVLLYNSLTLWYIPGLAAGSGTTTKEKYTLLFYERIFPICHVFNFVVRTAKVGFGVSYL